MADPLHRSAESRPPEPASPSPVSAPVSTHQSPQSFPPPVAPSPAPGHSFLPTPSTPRGLPPPQSFRPYLSPPASIQAFLPRSMMPPLPAALPYMPAGMPPPLQNSSSFPGANMPGVQPSPTMPNYPTGLPVINPQAAALPTWAFPQPTVHNLPREVEDGIGSPSGPHHAPLPPQPAESLLALGPPPFLTKTYDMVDDHSTDYIVSWSSTGNSFVVWDAHAFSRDLLPRFFKHNNFSSFGFRKVDPNRWEFANEGFLRGQKHQLKHIQRRKSLSQVQQQQQQLAIGAGGPCLEVGNYGGTQGEIERLRRDKNLLMVEVVRLRHQQQSTQQDMKALSQRLQVTEHKQQQMMTFLAKAMHNPTFMAQLVQQNEQKRQLQTVKKKRRLPRAGSAQSEETGSSSSTTVDGSESGQPADKSVAQNDSNQELHTLLQEMGQSQFNSDADGGMTPAGISSEDSLARSSGHYPQQQGGSHGMDKGKPSRKEAVKFEVPEELEDLDRTNAYILDIPDDDALWEQLFAAEQPSASANLNGQGNLFEVTGSSSRGGASPRNGWWETKPNVDEITEQLGHLGSSTGTSKQ